MKIADIRPGMVLYDRHTYRMGNTTLRTIGEWRVTIIDAPADATQQVTVSWNGNPPERWSWDRVKKLKTWSMDDECAEVVRGMWGRVVKVTLKKGYRPPPTPEPKP
jgi:hypothetical protein